ncbi:MULTISPECIES: alpha/beta hydrolase [unclassified Streptomyces]|uniref:alpha/beta hydrolase n=1 Tax=unclassified Streptomyces TaxID=2593676 RepID=UPI0006F76347|nr:MULTISPECIES: alpha/beta hydrolase [unclassified Streptomyces]KQX45601.1 proteinase [Streptomyces sp. Root1304]KRA79545.1 proteinase [Streptomyces sp. Root66D1]
MDSRRLLRTSATALAAAGLILSGCSGGSDAAAPRTTSVLPAAAPSSSPQALAKYYGQKLKWRDCGVATFQCATLRAPLDYAKPDAGDIDLAVSRVRATGPGKRLGSLLVNPGGPGGSAVGYLQGYAGIGYPAPVRARYDMVAVDPRGVARSEPVECLTGPQMDTYTQVDQTPDDTAEIDALGAAFEDFAAGCEKKSGKILPHVSTVETARDMDILRAVLGDEKLNYVGASYGTFLGATYAELFPARAGRLVLDGAMDPSLPALDLNRDQTAGFETSFRAFAADCVGRPDCPLGTGSVEAAGKALKKFFADVDAEPVPTGESRPLGESLATTGVIAAMYDEGAWPQLREALTRAMGGDGSGLLALADSYYEREADGTYANLMFANAAVNCLDLPPAYTGPADVEKAVPSFEKASPIFGEGLAWAALNCTSWPTPATGRPHRITAEGAAPILVVGTTRDPATPYKWAVSLAGQLSSGTLLTYEGDGHTAYGRGSDCIDTAINTYLLEGTPPSEGKRCS